MDKEYGRSERIHFEDSASVLCSPPSQCVDCVGMIPEPFRANAAPCISPCAIVSPPISPAPARRPRRSQHGRTARAGTSSP